MYELFTQHVKSLPTDLIKLLAPPVPSRPFLVHRLLALRPPTLMEMMALTVLTLAVCVLKLL